MQITIRIETNNAAFEDDLSEEVRRILSDLTYKWDARLPFSYTLKDFNGNTVGSATVEDQD